MYKECLYSLFLFLSYFAFLLCLMLNILYLCLMKLLLKEQSTIKFDLFCSIGETKPKYLYIFFSELNI